MQIEPPEAMQLAFDVLKRIPARGIDHKLAIARAEALDALRSALGLPAEEEDILAAFQRDMDNAPAIAWPVNRDVGRLGDMSRQAALRVGLDGDNDVCLSMPGVDMRNALEFCAPGAGGGRSSRTRMALIALMVAMEQDNADDPGRDWWAARMRGSHAR